MIWNFVQMNACEVLCKYTLSHLDQVNDMLEIFVFDWLKL